MTIELVSYADLKSFLGLEGETVADYPALSLIQTSVTAAIESYLGRNLTYSSYEITQQVWSITSMIRLSALPIDSIDKVAITRDGETASLTSSDYDVTDYGLYLYTPVARGSVSIEYDGGYTAATLPAAISRAALLQVALEFQTKDHVGASTVSTEGGMTQRPQLGLLKEVQRLLNSYRHPLSWGG